MKILLTSDWYASAVNGVVTSIRNLRMGLEAMGHEVRILTLSQNHHSYTEDGVTYIGSLPAGIVYPGARLGNVLAKKEVRELVKWNPDIIHSNCEFSTFPLARKIASYLDIPLVHTYHTLYENYTHYVSPSEKWGKKVVRVLTRPPLLNITSGLSFFKVFLASKYPFSTRNGSLKFFKSK